MALPLDQRIHLMGSIPIRVFFKKLQATSIAWLILSLVIGVVYLLDLFFGDSVRSVSPTIPDWVFWLVFGAFALYYWREILAAVAQYLMQTVQLGILVLLSLVVLFVGLSLLGKVSGYLSCWFLLSWATFFVLLELLDQEVQKWGEPWSTDKTEFPKHSLNGSTRCPLSSEAFKEWTASFLNASERSGRMSTRKSLLRFLKATYCKPQSVRSITTPSEPGD